eukprot:2374638-Pyramimonas_sp.AAC.1
MPGSGMTEFAHLLNGMERKLTWPTALLATVCAVTPTAPGGIRALGMPPQICKSRGQARSS